MANVTAPQFQQDVNNTADWANGDENTTVTMRLGQQADSPAKVIKDIKDKADAINAVAAEPVIIKNPTTNVITLDYSVSFIDVFVDGRLLAPDEENYTISEDGLTVTLNVLIEGVDELVLLIPKIASEQTAVDVNTGSIPLSSFATDTENKANEAWTKLIADGTKGLNVVIDDNPFTTDGRWYADEPCSIPSGATINFNQLVEWNNTDETKVYRRSRGIFEAIGTLGTETTTVTQDIAMMDKLLTVADASGFSVGDFVDIKIQMTGDNSTGYYPELYWVSQITEIDGNDIYIDVEIPWPVQITSGTVAQNSVTKIDSVARDITINNPRFLDTSPFVNYVDKVGQEQPDYVIGPLYFQYCHNIKINNVSGNRMKCPLVMFREYNDVAVDGLRLLNPDAYGPGEGYGVQFTRGVLAKAGNLVGINERHVVDFTSSWYYEVDKAYSPRTKGTATFINHGRFEAFGNWKNCIGDSLSFSAGFTFGSWSKEQSFSNTHVKSISGSRVNTWYSTNCTYEEFATKMYVDRFVADNTYADNTSLSNETRLPSNGMTKPLDSGVFISEGYTFSRGDLTGYDRVKFSDARGRYTGTVQNKMLITDVIDFSATGCEASHIEFQHAGICGNISYTNWAHDMDFTEYNGWGVGAIRASGMSLAAGFDKVNFKFNNLNFKMNAGTVAPIRISRGGTVGELIFSLQISNYTNDNCTASIAIDEDATFYAVGNVYGNTFQDGGFRVNDDDSGGTARNPIPKRIKVGPNNYLGTAVDYDNASIESLYETINPVTLSFSGGTDIPAQGELQALIPYNGSDLADQSTVFNFSMKGLPAGVSATVYFDGVTDNKWKVKVVNSTSSIVSVNSVFGILTVFNLGA